MKVSAVGVVVFVACLAFGSLAQGQVGLYLHINARQTTYIPYEPIWFFIQPENRGQEPLSYEGLHESVLTVVDSSGHQWPWREIIACPAAVFSLLPGQFGETVVVKVLDRCGEGWGSLNSKLPPGRYRAWGAYFTSDTVEFRVREPATLEEQAAVDLFAQARSIDEERSYKLSYESYRRVYSGHPHSALGAPALRMLRLLCNGVTDLDPAICRNHYCQFLVDYPESPLVESAIHPDFEPDWCVDSLRGSVLESLDTVIKSFRGTFIAERARKLKEKLARDTLSEN